MLYERIKKIIGYILASCIIMWGCAGCATNRGVDTTILEYQRTLGELEGRVDTISTAISESENRIGECTVELGNISEGIGSFPTEIDGIIYELDQYQQLVERLLQYYRELTEKIKDENNCISDTLDSINNNGDSKGGNTLLED